MADATVTPFDPKTFVGMVPTGSDIVIYEKGDDPRTGLVLYGFDEVEAGMLREDFDIPAYAFVSHF